MNAIVLFLRACLPALLISVILFASGLPTNAQQAEQPVLRVPWTGGDGPGFTTSDGTPRSFFIDLARLIAEEADFDIRLIEYPSTSAVINSVRDSETDFIVGAGDWAFDQDNVLVAGPIAKTQLLLFVRNTAPIGLSFETFTDGRLGAVRNTAASRTPPPEGVSIVEYDDHVTAFAKLLNKDVDGVLALSSLAHRTLFTTGLDTLIRATDSPIREVSLFAAIRRDYAEVLPRIEQAIARLEQSGKLDALRNTWFMVTPPPIPDVLTVGVTHFPPYYVVEDDGTVGGFAVEVIRELAYRAGLDLKFEVVSLESWSQGPRVGAFDLLPARSVTPDENELMEFTNPIQTIDYVPFVRSENADRALVPEDGRVGILFTAPLREEIARALDVDLATYETPEASVNALETGAIDALIYPRSAFESYLATHGGAERFAQLPEPEFRNDLAIAIRPGLANLDERLNVVIQGFIGSARYRAIASRWFDVPPFWTSERMRLAQFVAAGVLSVALLSVLLLSLQARRRALRHAESLKNLSNRLGAVLDTAQNAILGFNTAGEIAITNAGAQAMIPELGSEGPFSWPENISFFDIEERTPLDDTQHPIRRALSGSFLKGEVSLMCHDGDINDVRYVRVSSSPNLPAEADDISTVVILDDVSDLYQSRRNAEVQARMAAAAQKQESIGKLTGGIAHDFNNLLAVILGNLELLRAEETDPERTKSTEDAIDATLRGAELVRNMLAFARRSQLEAQVLDLNEIVRAVELLASRAVPASVEIETSLLAGLWKIRADRALTESALLNLILNANDAMEGAGQLTIETTNLRIEQDYIKDQDQGIPPGRYVMLAVSDNGSGISDENLKQIFEPFFTTKGPQGGSGLGLSMVVGFMQQSGGMVRVYSEIGVGTTFKLFFPALHRSEAKAMVSQAITNPGMGSGERILLVEDQTAVLAALERTLHRNGYSVVTAATGDLALEIFKNDPQFDLVVTDIVMPGRLQGPALVKALRDIQPDLPAIFMSGYAEEATIHGNGLRPSDIRLMKPVQRTAFLSAVERIIKEVPQQH